MSKRVFFGQNDIRFLYYRYKDSKYYSASVFFVTIAVCVILIVQVLIPQATNYLSIRQEIIAKQQTIRSINENITFISSLDKNTLNNQLETVSRALPSEKDFTGILNALASSSIRSGVTLSDFSFNVGEIASRSAKTTEGPVQPPTGIASQPNVQPIANEGVIAGKQSISVTVLASGSIDRISVFLKEIGEKLPLSEIVSVDNKDNTTTIILRFQYKDFPEVKFKEDSPIQPIDSQKVSLIEKIALWQKSSTPDEIFVPVGTNSATPLFE